MRPTSRQWYIWRIIMTMIMCTLSGMATADEPLFSGIVESNVVTADTTATGFSWGMEEFANLRMQADLSSRGQVHAAVNARAYSAKEEELAASGELERLYVSLYGETTDIDTGYMRIPFGYGQAFKPTDLINPPNPLYPEARPQGALGGVVSRYFPGDRKLVLFVADRNQPDSPFPGHSRPLGGVAGEIHTAAYSLQTLYALQAPVERGSSAPVHYAGVAAKYDGKAGYVLDMLYTGDGSAEARDGLQAAVGVDFSFLKGDLSVLVQYYYNGRGYLDTDDSLADLYGRPDWDDLQIEERIPQGGYADYYRQHYIYTAATYSADDYTRMIVSSLWAVEDMSVLPAVQFEHEPFQGVTLSVIGRYPLDSSILNGSTQGELGPDHTGYAGMIRASAKVRF